MVEMLGTWAVLSKCELYRYQLGRTWDMNLPPLVVGMLNPSKADAKINDPTITRLIERAVRNGFGSLVVWNLGAGRNTSPAEWKKMVDPIGPRNDFYIGQALIQCRIDKGTALVGWGEHGSFMGRDKIVLELARSLGVTLKCLGTNKGGQPKHPLYVSYDAPLQDWNPR